MSVPSDAQRRATLDRELEGVRHRHARTFDAVVHALVTDPLTRDLTVREVGQLADHIVQTIHGEV